VLFSCPICPPDRGHDVDGSALFPRFYRKESEGRPAIVFRYAVNRNAADAAQTIIPESFMLAFDAGHGFLEPFIEHQGERRVFWRRKPKAIGSSFLLARKGMAVPPSHRTRSVILLDFDRAFGTGGHGTTEGCLIALEHAMSGGETVLDVGTGTGILAIAAHKLGAARVTAVDIDKAACEEAKRNLAINGIEGEIVVTEGGIGSVDGRFDIIAANLRTPVLVGLMDELTGKLNPGGFAILSGIMERELHPFLSFLEAYPLEPVEIQRIRGWMTLALESEPDLAPPPVSRKRR
jgi:ribosomal protein L11 methyltransferase